MAPRAAWRVWPDDSRTSLGWLVADADARKLPVGSALGLAFALASLAALWSVWVLLFLPFLVLSTRIPARPRDLTPLQTTPPPGPAFECHIETLADLNSLDQGALLGSDEGIVTFIDGWLHYAGRRTEFALRHIDLRETTVTDGRLLLRLGADDWLAIMPLDERDADFLGRAARVWAESTPTPAGGSLFPPSAVHPSGIARAWRDALSTTAAILATFGVLLSCDASYFVFVFAGGGWITTFRRLGTLRRRALEEGEARLEGRRA